MVCNPSFCYAYGRKKVDEMILADKIINERKKCGWSQEELAEKLNVSRQSVSKWEGAQATPDIQKILKMAELFGVSTDYLLKDELEPEAYVPESFVSAEPAEDVRKVSFEEANEFVAFEEKNAPKVANGVSLCIISPALLILLGGLTESKTHHVSEGLAAGLGMAVLLGLVALAVYMFISYGMQRKRFEYLEKESIETAYGVDGMVREKRKNNAAKHSSFIAIGVVLCVLSAVPFIVTASMEAPDSLSAAMVSVLLIIVAVGVNLIVRAGVVRSCYDMLLQENEYTKTEKAQKRKLEVFSGVYWCVAVAVYLAWSFTSYDWDFTWIVWPIAGVLYAAAEGIVKSIIKNK